MLFSIETKHCEFIRHMCLFHIYFKQCRRNGISDQKKQGRVGSGRLLKLAFFLRNTTHTVFKIIWFCPEFCVLSSCTAACLKLSVLFMKFKLTVTMKLWYMIEKNLNNYVKVIGIHSQHFYSGTCLIILIKWIRIFDFW